MSKARWFVACNEQYLHLHLLASELDELTVTYVCWDFFDPCLQGNGNISAQNHEIDEQGVQNAHTEAYQNGNAGSLPASSVGAAAALQAIKNFTSGGGSASSGGGDMKSKLMGMAMAEASKLYESQGAGSGGKQEVINSAAETVMKFVMKSQMSSMIGGGNSGGLGGLASIVSGAICFGFNRSFQFSYHLTIADFLFLVVM